MRVVSGSARGTRLFAVPGETTRPILDRVKTALFDTIRPAIQSATVLDLFAGSGSVGIEALSQGAASCYFLDIAPKAIETIHKNLQATQLSSKAVVKKVDAFAFLKRAKGCFDIIYIAPPQYKQLWIIALRALAERTDLLNKNFMVIAQIDPQEYEKLDFATFKEDRIKTYGNSMLVFYKANF